MRLLDVVCDPEQHNTHLVPRTAEQDAEMMRLQILGNPELMRSLQEVLQLSPFTFLTFRLTSTCYIDSARACSCGHVKSSAVRRTLEGVERP